MDLRQEFVLRANAPGSCIAELCREYGVSRKTGYKWLARFEVFGVQGLDDMSRRPRRTVQTSGEVVLRLQELRATHPKWGPKKLRVLLQRSLPEGEAPSVKTIARILDRLGAARIRAPRRPSTSVDRQAPRLLVQGPNDVWTVDFKGWWRTRDGKRCEPLTVRDAFSRYVFCLKALASTSTDVVQPVFEDLFKRFGLPATIHVDNGAPFGSTQSRCGLSRLSAWWLAVGVKPSFSRPASPQDNGGHERMHADVAFELEESASDTLLQQQRACDAWVEEFNHVRPHEALAMQTPATSYVRSSRPFRGIRPVRYKIGMDVRCVKQNGVISLGRDRLFIGTAFSGYQVGVERLAANIVRVHFYELDLGLFELPTVLGTPRRNSATPSTTSAPARCSTKSAGQARSPRPSSTPTLRRPDRTASVTLIKKKRDNKASSGRRKATASKSRRQQPAP